MLMDEINIMLMVIDLVEDDPFLHYFVALALLIRKRDLLLKVQPWPLLTLIAYLLDACGNHLIMMFDVMYI